MTKTKNTNRLNKLFNPNFLWFWQGQIVSGIGSQIYYMAMILWITESTDSASLLGLMGMVAGIPTIFLSAVGGTIADRYSRRNIMLFGDGLNSIILFVLAYMFYSNSSNTSMLVAFVMATAFMSSIISSFFIPAASAAIPDLVPEDKLTAANSFRQSAFQIATIAGWTLSSFLYVYLGIVILTIFNAITFVYGAITKYFVHIPIAKRDTIKGNFANKFLSEIKDGFSYVWEKRGLRKIIIASLMINFFSIPVLILLPFYVKNQLVVSQHWLPILMSINIGGTMVGVILAGAVKLNSAKRGKAIMLAMVLNSIFILFLGVNKVVVGAIIIIIGSGAAAGYIQVHIQTLMQLTTAQEIRGRVFGLISTVTGALTPIGMGLAGLIGDLTNKNFFLIFGISGITLLLVSVLAIASKDIRMFLSMEHQNNKVKQKESEIDSQKPKENISESVSAESVLNVDVMDNLKNKLK